MRFIRLLSTRLSLLTLVLASLLVGLVAGLAVGQTAQHFDDVPVTHANADDVHYVATHGLMTGYANDQSDTGLDYFHGTDKLSRFEAAASLRAVHEDINAAEKRALAAVDDAEIDAYRLALCTHAGQQDSSISPICTDAVHEHIRAIHEAWLCPHSTNTVWRPKLNEPGQRRIKTFIVNRSQYLCDYDRWPGD